MYHQNHVLNALRATAYTADPDPNSMPLEWNREGLADPAEVEFEKDDPGDEFRPTGNEKFDAIVRAANPRIHYGMRAAYSKYGEGFDEDHIDPDTVYDYIAFPPLRAFRGEGEQQRVNYLRTLAHELVHWTQGDGRVERPRVGMSEFDRFMAMVRGVPPESYVQEELTAEMGATLLMDAVGVDPNMPARAHYIANWAHAAHPDSRERLLDAAEATAKRAVDWLLSKVGMEASA